MFLLAGTSFLNADLMIRSSSDLNYFSKELEQRGFMVVGDVHQMDDGLWTAAFELDADIQPESETDHEYLLHIVDGLLSCVEALPQFLKKQWDELQERTLDMGFEAGTEVRQYTRQISLNFLERMVAAGIVLAITIYAPAKEGEGPAFYAYQNMAPSI
jgi:hypothetical protein